MRRANWRLWGGFVLTIVAFVSYLTFFVRFPVTRDVPWVSFLLFAIALVLLFGGFRRAQRKIVASIITILSVAIMAFFSIALLYGARQLPASHGALAIAQKAPDFTLLDTEKRPVTLTRLLAAPNTKGVLLIFYRGYW